MNRFRSVLLILVLVGAAAPAADPPGAYLGDLTWPEAEKLIAGAPLVIVPFAAGAKEHGPHLPMNADRIVAEHLLDAAIASEPVIVAPIVLYGWFPAFRDFPGTEIRDPGVFQAYMFEAGMSLARHGAQRLVFLNTGIANATGLPISIAAREIRVQAAIPVLVVSWGDLETDETALIAEQREGGHADEIETSINLFLQSENVRMERAVRDYGNRSAQESVGYQPGVLSRNRADPGYSETGLYGDPTLATAEKGRRALAIMTAEWLRAIREFAATPRGDHGARERNGSDSH